MTRETILGTCTYCGRYTEVEDDHVVPRSLFAHENQCLVKVSCCRTCNVKKSAGEGELPVYMLGRPEITDEPTLQHVIPEVLAAIDKDVSRLARSFASAQVEPFSTKNGIYLGLQTVADIEEAFRPALRSLEYTVRGLYAWHTDDRLDASHPVHLLFPRPEQVSAIDPLKPFVTEGPYTMGSGVFTWAPILPKEHHLASAWIMVFFKRVLVIGLTGLGVPAHLRSPIKRQARPRKLRRKDQERLDRLVQSGLIVLPPDNYLKFLAESENKSPDCQDKGRWLKSIIDQRGISE